MVNWRNSGQYAHPAYAQWGGRLAPPTFRGDERWRTLGTAILEVTGAGHIQFAKHQNMRFTLTYSWDPPIWIEVHDMVRGELAGTRRWRCWPKDFLDDEKREQIERCLLLLT